jgi:2,3-bisphosphoglycerate-independent phosphoglycerate mutase
MSALKPVILVIFDGFGIAPPADGNAIARANMPIFKKLVTSYPAMTLQSAGSAVGLSWGEMGNSEVGHLTIGAGRVFYQSLPRINLSIEKGEFFQNTAFKKAVAHVKKTGGRLHLLGMVSPGGVHASQEHLSSLLEFCKREGIKDPAIHAILDGRDAVFNSGIKFIEELQQKITELKVGEIASLSGRFYAMDRDHHWERVQKTYQAMVTGDGRTADDPVAAIQESYDKKVYDEELEPVTITKKGKPVGLVNDNDAVIFFNFRPDRVRELTKAFVLPVFDKFPRPYFPNLFFVTMTEFEKDLPVEVAFPPQVIEVCLARVVSDAGRRQLHIAETEKYAHITFFLNGMREEAFPGEERVIIPSPRVSSYDQQPEMSTAAITDRTVKEIASGAYDFIAINFASPDMVAHTGNEEATVKACESVDRALGQITEAVLAVGGALVVTADHGNAEEVKNLVTGEMDKEHSTNPVPCIVISRDLEGVKAPSGDVIGGDLSVVRPVGMLSDVAPTVLKLMGLDVPPDMTGRALV